jgi:hypothetical protein
MYRFNLMNKILVFTVVMLVSATSAHAMSSAENGVKDYHPVIVEVSGDVQIMDADRRVWTSAAAGALLLAGDTIKTGEDGRVRIRFKSGMVDIFETTVLRIPSLGEDPRQKDIRQVEIEDGSAKFNINKQGAKRKFEFKTRHIQGGVKGTRFTVKSDTDTSRVAVYEGEVVVSASGAAAGPAASLTRGYSLSTLPGKGLGRVERFDASGDFTSVIPGRGLGPVSSPPGLDRDSGSPGRSGDAPGHNK